ncbi:MAG: hypothetical protein ISS01_03185, partial [Nanoarchaeota archaeon]|nr:hypothetical protein [Nanoarchaeota archaeon]
MAKSRSQNNGKDWKYGIDDVRVLVYPDATDFEDLDKWKNNVLGILNSAEVRTGVVNLPGYRGPKPVMAVEITNFEDHLRFYKHLLGKRSKVGTPVALRGALNLEELFERRNEEEEYDVLSCDTCEVLGEGFTPMPEGTLTDLQEEVQKLEQNNIRLRSNNDQLGKHNDKLTIANREHKVEKVYLKKRINDLSKLVSDEETLRNERDQYLERAKSIDINLRLAQEPLLRELGLVERISRRMDSVTELLDGRNLDELRNDIEDGEETYISNKHDIEVRLIQNIEMIAATGIESMEGYQEINRKVETARKTIEYVNSLAEIFDKDGKVINESKFRETFRGMPLALANLAYSTFQTGKEELSEAEAAIQDLEKIENRFERTKALSEQIKETRREY